MVDPPAPSIEILERGSIRRAYQPVIHGGVPPCRGRKLGLGTAMSAMRAPEAIEPPRRPAQLRHRRTAPARSQRNTVVVAQKLDRKARCLDGAGGNHIHQVADAAGVDQAAGQVHLAESAAPRSAQCPSRRPEAPSSRPDPAQALFGHQRAHGRGRAVLDRGRRPGGPRAPTGPRRQRRKAAGAVSLAKAHGAGKPDRTEVQLPRRKRDGFNLEESGNAKKQRSQKPRIAVGAEQRSSPWRIHWCRAAQAARRVPAKAQTPPMATASCSGSPAGHNAKQHGPPISTTDAIRKARARHGGVAEQPGGGFTPIRASSSRSGWA